MAAGSRGAALKGPGDEAAPAGAAKRGGGASALTSFPVPPGFRPRARGEENGERLRRRLWGDAGALAALRDMGLRDATVRRFRLGLKEPYLSRVTGLTTERALAIPVPLPDGSASSRWAFLNLPGVTRHPAHPFGWGAGRPHACHSRAVTRGSTLLVVPNVLDLWLLSQVFGEAYDSIVVSCPSHPGGEPAEWSEPGYWRLWDAVVLGLGDRLDETELASAAAARSTIDLRRAVMPRDETWTDLVRMGASAQEVRALVRSAVPWAPEPLPSPVPEESSMAGEFHAEPISVEGAYVGGRLHHVVTVERRCFQDRGRRGAVLVQRYETRVLRSDGRLLDVEVLPAPPGTPRHARVLALSDGTRITSAPAPGRFNGWRHASMMRFVADRASGRDPAHRDLPRLLSDVEEHLRSAVWLPRQADFATLALYVMATFVHRVFDAFPILLVNGPRGSGKSELGGAIAAMALNGLLVGRITGPGLVRLLAESRGTVVLDDLEKVGAGRGGTDDISQILKVSYKQATATRVCPGRDGRVEIQDFFSPKIVSNISGGDPVLLSRMIAVSTRPLPAGQSLSCDGGIDVAALRDEAHVWAMCSAPDVEAAYRPLSSAVGSRSDEIAAPLRAMAVLAGGSWAIRLEESLDSAQTIMAEPLDALLERALRRLVAEGGARALAMPHLRLEMALASPVAPLPSAETLGRMLLGAGARREADTVERRRLHGEVVRIYRLADDYVTERRVADSPAEPDPFAFCTGRRCAECPYDPVCDATAPGLRERKNARERAA
ncbi:DUF3631 domain-containing protein [Sphingomonas sp. RHCKR7]|uniref:DUF3631 domain-containing protein n=1 Tax=Sphingomonas folli TaxID=2862497 RepID=UPI001CA5A64F|nr:DUF3631 domain-containing protein [Sphingomonas folli]MBW6528539.1 DUF3631 domain-containing protein [Sphingomonas folli]